MGHPTPPACHKLPLAAMARQKYHSPDLNNEQNTVFQRILASLESGAGESLHKLRLGRGFVGKLSVVAIAAIAAVAYVAAKAGGATLAWGAIVAVCLVFGAALWGTLWVISAHPELALMEGAELVMWQQLKTAVKGEPPFIDSVPIPDPALPDAAASGAVVPADGAAGDSE
jgi:hypothetical protein